MKICGLSTEEAIDAAIEAGADYIGLVSFPRSPRHVDPVRAAALAGHVGGRVPVALLTVDASPDELAELVDLIAPDMLQLHGAETPVRVREVRARHGVETWKSLPVANAADIAAAVPYAGFADRILFDARPPRDATRPGGNGLAFDWTLLATPGAPANFVLSGGLNAGNVGEAIAIAHPAIVDVSSGVESAPGVKDLGLIRDFAGAVRKQQPQPTRRAS